MNGRLVLVLALLGLVVAGNILWATLVYQDCRRAHSHLYCIHFVMR